MVNTSWLKISKPGLYVLPAKAHIDPIRAVDTAIITHGHSDQRREVPNRSRFIRSWLYNFVLIITNINVDS